MEYVYINLRVPAKMAQDLEKLALAEAERTGLNVTRSELVRRAITEDLAKRTPVEKKGGAE